MSVVLVFTVDSEAFQLGRILGPPTGMRVELERVVPTGSVPVPFLWVTGEAFGAFEDAVDAHEDVERLTPCDRFESEALYRLEWDHSPTGLVATIAASDAVVLEAQGGERWLFRLRFPSHGSMSSFNEMVTQRGVPIRVERTVSATESLARDERAGLTPDQHRALVLALQRGYFASPSEVSLGVLAAELGISQQAMSKRVRRGNEGLLREVLLDG